MTANKERNIDYFDEVGLKLTGFLINFLKNNKTFWKIFLKALKKGDYKLSLRDRARFKFSQREMLLFPLSVDFNDLYFTFEVLDKIAFFIENYPNTRNYKGAIKKSEWALYHYHYFFQQLYILRERIIKFLSVLEKLTRKQRDSRFLQVEKLKEKIIADFDPFVLYRGKHTHAGTVYEKDIWRAGCLETFKFPKTISVRKGLSYRQGRRSSPKNLLTEKARGIRKMNELLEKLLNRRFKLVWEIIEKW